MNFNNNTMLYPKKDELNPTKDDGVNPSFYPKEEGFNPFNGIVERINTLESITQNYEDSFETKQLTVTENTQIENLNATEGTVNRLNSANATVTNLNSTNATVINADVENAQIENLNATEGTVDTLNSTTSTITNLNSTTSTVTNGNIKNAKVESLNATEGKVNTLESTNATVTNLNSTNATVNTLNSTTSTVTNLNSTNGNIKNAEVENLNATEGTVDTLESTTSTVTNGNIKNAKVESLNVTKNAEIKKLHATEGTVDTLNLTNCNIKNADIENLHTNKLTWDLPNIDVINAETIKLHATEGTVDTLNSTNGNIINAEVEKLNVTTEIKVGNFKTEEPIFSNAVVGYDENGKMIPIKIAELEEKVDKDLANATGTLPVANGGTGATTAKGAQNALLSDMQTETTAIDDSTEFVMKYGTPTDTKGALFKRSATLVWNYIKDKISSVLGLTSTKYNGTAVTSNKIVPNYTTSVALTSVSSNTIKYIKLADCNWHQAGTLQVFLNGDSFRDTLVINFGGGNGQTPMLCGHYSGNSGHVRSVIAQKGSSWDSSYSIYVKINQETTCTVKVALLKGECTINITESTTAPTNISEWLVSDGFFGNITAPNITSLEQRVTALESKFDYTVDSQQKFDDLLSILKSGNPNTYRSIAIIGGLGNGEHGEYLYTVDSNSGDANLNNASLIGLNNPKIVITINNANTNIFKNGLIEDIDFNIGGTVNDGKTVALLYRCTYNNGKIALNNTSAKFNIVDTTLSNVINDECKSFFGCTLNDCETIPSEFTNCSSEMLYVSTDTNIANKYSFNKCGIHLDMKKTDMTQLETVTINIASITDSKLSVLDTSSKLKKIILNVDASDSLSEIVGNNDKKYSIYEPFVKRVSKSVSPSMRSKAYLSYHDESHTPIFSNDGVKFYLDESMTQQVYCYSTTNSNNERIWMFALENDTTHCYSSLTFNKEITYSQKDGESVADLKLSDFGDEFILNGNPLKTYICRNDESGTLLYSNDNGTNIYISPYINDDNKVQYANPNTASKLFMIGQFSYLTKNLGAFNVQPSFSDLNFATPQLLEVTALKDNYAVQVVSNYDVPIYVENAFSTKVKNG